MLQLMQQQYSYRFVYFNTRGAGEVCRLTLAAAAADGSATSPPLSRHQYMHHEQLSEPKIAVPNLCRWRRSRRCRRRAVAAPSRSFRQWGNSPLSYKLQRIGMMLLHKLTLGVVPKPALLRLMGGENVSYSTALMYNLYYEKMICLAGLALFSAPMVAWYNNRRKA